GQFRGQRLCHSLHDDGEGACIANGKRVGFNLAPLFLGSTLGAEAPERVDRLWREPDMTHHRYPALDEKADRLGHLAATLELDRTASRLLQDAGGVAEGHFRAFLV